MPEKRKARKIGQRAINSIYAQDGLGILCPCGNTTWRVIRVRQGENVIRRERTCLSCGYVANTYEVIDDEM